MQNSTYVCLNGCRLSFKAMSTCPKCRQQMFCTGTRWRAPRKSNVKAWRRIETAKYAVWNPAKQVDWRKAMRIINWETSLKTHDRFCQCMKCQPVRHRMEKPSAKLPRWYKVNGWIFRSNDR